MSEHFGYQPAVAFRLDDVVDAMRISHDRLIVRAGRLRASGISWEIWGSELAGVLARTKTGVSVRDDNGWKTVSGTLDEGLNRLDSLANLEPAPGGHDPELDRLAVAETKAAARAHPDATLVIAYCDIRLPSEARR